MQLTLTLKMTTAQLVETSVTKPERNPRLQGDSNPWPLRYRCSALPTEQ